MHDRTVAVTGANGFIGRTLVSALLEGDYRVIALSRSEYVPLCSDPKLHIKRCPELLSNEDWSECFGGSDIIIHTAGRSGAIEGCDNTLLEFCRVNSDATERLAYQAASSGVKRFIFLSSAKVVGEVSGERAFVEDDKENSFDFYAISKSEAEKKLKKVRMETGMDVVIVRPPVVYGSGMKSNLKLFFNFVQRGVPLPFALANRNKRSLISIDNLIDFIITCVRFEGDISQTFFVSDDEDISTKELLKRISRAMHKPSYLFPLPVSCLKFIAGLAGKEELAQRLFDDFRLDITKAKQFFGWSPKLGVDEGLAKTMSIKYGKSI